MPWVVSVILYNYASGWCQQQVPHSFWACGGIMGCQMNFFRIYHRTTVIKGTGNCRSQCPAMHCASLKRVLQNKPCSLLLSCQLRLNRQATNQSYCTQDSRERGFRLTSAHSLISVLLIFLCSQT